MIEVFHALTVLREELRHTLGDGKWERIREFAEMCSETNMRLLTAAQVLAA